MVSCNGFIVSIPPTLTVHQTAAFQWNGNLSDFDTPTGNVGIWLVSPPGGVQCPRSNFADGIGMGAFDIFDDETIITNYGNGTGTLLLTVKNSR
ncbi:hypothetical protein V5O48_017163, partial [Marasmius crinis-equi]